METRLCDRDTAPGWMAVSALYTLASAMPSSAGQVSSPNITTRRGVYQDVGPFRGREYVRRKEAGLVSKVHHSFQSDTDPSNERFKQTRLLRFGEAPARTKELLVAGTGIVTVGFELWLSSVG